MTTATSSAAPTRLAAYATAHDLADEPLAAAVVRLAADVAAFLAGAGDGAPTGAGGALTPLLDLRAEAAHVASWVAGVGDAFRRAGADPDGDGTWSVADDRLPSLGPATRAAWLDRVAADLAGLSERADAHGPPDPDALAALSADARRLLATAPDPQAEGARLLARVGPGDVAVAVDALVSATDEARHRDDPAVVALSDLGFVLSAGLERQPGRAARWADELTGPLGALDLVGAPHVDGLALLGAGNAPGTAAFGTALAAALSASGVATAPSGPVRRLHGSTDPLAPTLATAAARGPDGRFTQAPLAHGVVDALARRTHGQGLLASFSLAAEPVPPAPGSRVDARAEALRAAVDPALPDAERVRLALVLSERFTATPAVASLVPDRPDVAEPWSPQVTRALGAATQPLLEHWVDTGDGGEIRWLSAPGVVTAAEDGGLWDEIGALALATGGSDGVGEALVGAAADRLAASAAVTAQARAAGLADPQLDPFGAGALRALGAVEGRVAAAVGDGRFAVLVETAQGPTTRAARVDAAAAIALGAMGEVPGGSTAAGIVEGLDRLASIEAPLTFAGSPTSGLRRAVTGDLVVANLVRYPHLATAEVVDALAAAAEAGPRGVYALLHDDAAALRFDDGRPLAELQRLVAAQEAVVAAGRTDALAELVPGGGS